MRRGLPEYRLYSQARISNGLNTRNRVTRNLQPFGRKFYALEPTDERDVYAICSANGVTDRKIDYVMKEASACDFDLRRVKKIHS